MQERRASSIEKNIFDMLDRVKFLLDKKYEQNPKGNADNPKIIKGENVMKHIHDETRHNAYAHLGAANRAMNKTRNPYKIKMYREIADDATATIERLDRMDDARPYSDTNIGYGADVRRHARTTDDARDLVHAAMDAVDRILPHLDDRYDDDMDEVDDRRGRGWRPRTTRRGVGRFTQVRRHVRRMPGRSDMDDTYDLDDRYDDRYDNDDRYDVDDRRGIRMPRRGRSGRFIRGDADRYDRMDNRTDDDRRMRTDRTTDANPMDDRYDDRRTDERHDDRTDDRRTIGPRG